jgi:hypothetical protein
VAALAPFITQYLGAIKQIYLDAILAGAKVDEEIDKSSCARHVQAIIDRQELRVILHHDVSPSLYSATQQKEVLEKMPALAQAYAVSFSAPAPCIVTRSHQVPQPGWHQQQQENE